MQISVTFRHMDSSDSLRDYAVSKVERLGKFYDGVVDAYVTLEAEKGRHVARLTLNAAGTQIRAEEISPDMYAAIDMLADKAARQLRKHHDKVKDRHKREAARVASVREGAGAAEPEDPSEERAFVRKAFPLRPTFPDDAALELERSGLSFFVFLNAETEQVNVVYRLPDGRLGLLEPSAS